MKFDKLERFIKVICLRLSKNAYYNFSILKVMLYEITVILITFSKIVIVIFIIPHAHLVRQLKTIRLTFSG